MIREAIRDFGFFLIAIGVLDAVFGPAFHPDRDNGLLDAVLMIGGLVVSATACRSLHNSQKPWIPHWTPWWGTDHRTNDPDVF